MARPTTPQAKRRRRGTGWQLALLGLIALLVATAGAGLMWLDSPAGHRFIVAQVGALTPKSGLKISVGAIEGSVFRSMRLHNVRLSDLRGPFLAIPEVQLDWWPWTWALNRVEIDRIGIARARLARLPKLRSSGEQGKLLPDFDLRIMEMRVGRLEIGAGFTGRRQIMTLTGDADIRSGRAMLDIDARALTGDDRLLLALDSRPDDNRFDIDLTVNAPRDGVLAHGLGFDADANIRLGGDGDWHRWRGSLVATLAGQPAAGLSLLARDGQFDLSGTIEQRALAGRGILQKLAAPSLGLAWSGRFERRVLRGMLQVQSRALALDASGGIDLGRGAFDQFRIDARLAGSKQLVAGTDGEGLEGRVRLDGPFQRPAFDYLLLGKRIAIGPTILHELGARGSGRIGGRGALHLPIALSIAAVDGQGDMIGAMLRGLRIDGWIEGRDGLLALNTLAVRSDRMTGQLDGTVDLRSGRYDLALDSRVTGLPLPGLGVTDLTGQLQARPDARGAFALAGNIAARFTRLDDAFLRGLAGGLPHLSAGIEVTEQGGLKLSELSLRAPALALDGEAERAPGDSYRVTAKGRHASYGPVVMALSGELSHPRVALDLDRPMDALGLAQVHAEFDPGAEGYSFTAGGGSTLGGFDTHGRILLRRGEAATIAVGALNVGGAAATGNLRVIEGALAGTLDLSGAVTGTLALTPRAGGQEIVAALRARDARFEGPVALAVRTGQLDATLFAHAGETSMDGVMRARGLAIGRFRVNEMAGAGKLVNGAGQITFSLNGRRGRAFALQAQADVKPDMIMLAMNATLDRDTVRLDRPARLERGAQGDWTLMPVTLRYRGGSARLGGQWGAHASRLDVATSRLPLSLLDLANTDLGLAGIASGSLSFASSPGAAPRGAARFTVTGFSRSGVTRTSLPIDWGMNAVLGDGRLAVRAIARTTDNVIARAQAQFTGIGPGPLWSEIQTAQVRGQMRYAGPAEAIWRLARAEFVDLTGPVSLGANLRGTLADPRIDGAFTTSSAALSSPVTGMSLTALRASGRFDGSRLTLPAISAGTRGGGSVTGHGTIDFSSVAGVAMDLAFVADNAEMLNRDDIGAFVSGPIALRSDGRKGLVKADLQVTRARFTMGRAAEVAQIPELRVIERHGGRDDFDLTPAYAPWALDIDAHAPGRLTVDGLGLNSEWRTDLHIGGVATAPALTGSADLVRGSYDFAGRRFDLSSGRLRFDGRTPVNPTLEIAAQGSVTGLSATIHVTGSSLNPVIGFTSVPALPEDEVLSRVLFGSSITQLSGPEALQLAAAVASLQGKGGGLDPINAVRKAAGLDRLRFLPADRSTGARASVSLGKYLTQKTYVELVTDGQGYSATRMEYQITRWLSLLASVSTIGRQSGAVRISKDY